MVWETISEKGSNRHDQALLHRCGRRDSEPATYQNRRLPLPDPGLFRRAPRGQGARLSKPRGFPSTSRAAAARRARATGSSRSRCTSCPMLRHSANPARASCYTTSNKLDSQFKGKSSRLCSTMTVEGAAEFFKAVLDPTIRWTRWSRGLGFIKGGAAGDTLSGGRGSSGFEYCQGAGQSGRRAARLIPRRSPLTGLHFEE